MRARGAPYLIQVLILGVAYIIGARLGQLVAIPPGNVSALWAPSGIAVAAVALLGLQVWPGIWLGSFAYNFVFFHGDPTIHPSVAMAMAVGIATGSTLMAVAARLLAQLVQGREAAVESPRDVLLWTLGAGFGAAIISASVGTLMLSTGGILPVSPALAWRTWWIGDATGIVLITPAAILWGRLRAPRFRAGQEIESLAAACVLAVTCLIAFGTSAPGTWAPYLLALPLLFLSYSAVRFGRRVTTATGLVLALVAAWATASGRGPLHAMEPANALIVLQVFLSFGTIVALMLATVASQGRKLIARPDALPQETGAFPLNDLLSRQHATTSPVETTPPPASPAAPPAPPPPAPDADLRAILAALPEPVYVLARESLSVSHCNAPFARALGLADRAAIEAKSLFDLFPPALAMAAADEARRVFSTGEARAARERWPHGDGTSDEFEVHRTPLQGPTGEVHALLARARRIGP